MNQYQRIVSYIYHYINGNRQENAGFIRLERLGERCKITVQVKSRQPANTKLHLFQIQEKTLMRKPLVDLQGNGLIWRTRIETSWDNPGNSGWNMESTQGMLLGIPEDYYAACWINRDHLPALFVSDSDSPAIADSHSESISVSVPEVSAASLNSQPPLQLNGPHPVIESSPKPARNLSDYGQQILESFPPLDDLKTPMLSTCVRIEPKDIGCLPIAAWSLAGNHFLLHGYYCYRHLLFGKWKEGGYCVGVPGIFCPRTQSQAKDFGFDQFVSLTQDDYLSGCFGYWIHLL